MTFNYQLTNHYNNPQRDSTAYEQGMQSIGGDYFVKASQQAQKIIPTWDNYAPTPLVRLDDIEQQSKVAKVYYKDESVRFGLGSFKALGGAYAIQKLINESSSDLIVCTATDGNHGRSVAWGAQQLGVECHIFIHAGVSQSRADSMAAYGATIHRIKGNYDHSVEACNEMATQHGWQVVSDTSWPGYDEIPKQVMAGYTVMVSEIIEQLQGEIPTHIFIPAGCGGLAGGVMAAFWTHWRDAMPDIIIVESDMSDCVYQSLKQNAIELVDIVDETIMAGLSCGEVSQLAWSLLRNGVSHVITLDDDGVAPMMRQLAIPSAGTQRPSLEAGECSAAGAIALLAIIANGQLSSEIGIDNQSRVLLLGTEGATDQVLYDSIING